MSDEQPCQPGEHRFGRSRDTNEPVGNCVECAVSVDWAEAQDENQEPLAFADVPESDREAYLEALDRESVRENR